jgi:hypothetical protein
VGRDPGAPAERVRDGCVDWTWHVGLPLVAYAAIVGAGITVLRRAAGALHVVAAAALLLLFVGIHNAWDSAVWIATHRSPREG